MKLKKPLATLASSLLALNVCAAAASETGNLTIEMQGIRANQGQAIFILMDSESSHRGNSPIFSRKLVAVNQISVKATFSNLPKRAYSAVIYHDLNGNGKLDRNFFGKPKEPYGFSNNARNSFGIPGFDESRFEVNSSHYLQNITVK